MKHEQKKIDCDGKRLMIGDIELEVDFIWTPSKNEGNDDIVTITVGYAPYYTLISLQTFNIPPNKINVGNIKQEM